MNHPNIVKCYDVRVSDDQKYLYIILEYCNHGTLKKVMESSETVSPF